MFIRSYSRGDADNGEIPWSKSAPRQLYEVIYNVLDVVEERTIADYRENAGNEVNEGKPPLRDHDFIGCLGVFGSTAVYGSITNGGYKLLIAIRATSKCGEEESNNSSLRSAFRKLGDALIAALLNPMYEGESPLHSEKFSRVVAQIVGWYD